MLYFGVGVGVGVGVILDLGREGCVKQNEGRPEKQSFTDHH